MSKETSNVEENRRNDSCNREEELIARKRDLKRGKWVDERDKDCDAFSG